MGLEVVGKHEIDFVKRRAQLRYLSVEQQQTGEGEDRRLPLSSSATLLTHFVRDMMHVLIGELTAVTTCGSRQLGDKTCWLSQTSTRGTRRAADARRWNCWDVLDQWLYAKCRAAGKEENPHRETEDMGDCCGLHPEA
ncbi:hypothetical protein Scep_029712 [Stephania cephalantha]|uniref:Uncharacterized protein n=1 Tax=Stephania cephalantha TaxID=152367 RepID=A0AAP0DYF0_9MAGN